jgi:hypothetical protein
MFPFMFSVCIASSGSRYLLLMMAYWDYLKIPLSLVHSHFVVPFGG